MNGLGFRINLTGDLYLLTSKLPGFSLRFFVKRIDDLVGAVRENEFATHLNALERASLVVVPHVPRLLHFLVRQAALTISDVTDESSCSPSRLCNRLSRFWITRVTWVLREGACGEQSDCHNEH